MAARKSQAPGAQLLPRPVQKPPTRETPKRSLQSFCPHLLSLEPPSGQHGALHLRAIGVSNTTVGLMKYILFA